MAALGAAAASQPRLQPVLDLSLPGNRHASFGNHWPRMPQQFSPHVPLVLWGVSCLASKRNDKHRGLLETLEKCKCLFCLGICIADPNCLLAGDNDGGDDLEVPDLMAVIATAGHTSWVPPSSVGG